MKDSERLELLKEVAGTRVYDERKAESEKIIKETGFLPFILPLSPLISSTSDEKAKQVDEMLEYIAERLNKLEAEKEELKEYQKHDRDKRALEYAMYDKELHSAQEKLTRVHHFHSSCQK